MAEGGGDNLALEIHEAREEYTRGKVRKGTVTELPEDLHQREWSYGAELSSAHTSGLCESILNG